MRSEQIKNITLYFTFLLITWGFYRLLFQFPDPLDDLLVKPVIWLIPLFIFLKKERKGLESIGVTSKRLLTSIYFALILGMIFAFEGLVINFLKYGGRIELMANTSLESGSLIFSLLLSLIVAVSEELVFRGYLLSRIGSIFSNEWKANIITTVLWASIHLPIAIFDWRLKLGPLSVYLFLLLVFGFGAAFLMQKTKNIIAPIILHVLWTWPIILFR